MDLALRLFRWLADRFLFLTDDLTLNDLMRLAEDDTLEWQDFVEKTYDWEHSRRIEIGKWFLALAAVLVAAIVTVMGKPEPPPSFVVSMAGVGAGIFATSGMITIWTARRTSAHLARTTTLVARLVAIRTFLTRVRQEEGL